MSARDDLIALARTQVGTIERVNNRTKYGVWYGMDGNPWCAMFLSWLHGQLGQSDLVNFSTSKGYAYTPSGYQGFKNRGRVFRDAQPGDHVFFQFSGPRIHHVGLVIGVGPGYIDTIEGNTSRGSGGSQVDGGGVWYRRRSSGIVGFGRPAYAAGPDRPLRLGDRLLRQGDKGPDVGEWQRILTIPADGDFGAQTHQATVAFQQHHRLDADGVVGPATLQAAGQVQTQSVTPVPTTRSRCMYMAWHKGTVYLFSHDDRGLPVRRGWGMNEDEIAGFKAMGVPLGGEVNEVAFKACRAIWV